MIELKHICCMEYMKGLPDKAFELAIVDPPYGIDYTERGNGSGGLDKHNWMNHSKKQWDVSTPNEKYFTELLRVSKNQIVWGGNYFTMYLPASKCWLMWDKIQEFSNSDFELAYTSFNSSCKAFRMARVVAYTHQLKIHPTQKPVKLYKWLLKNYAKEGDKIFDSHGGSMSIALACHDLNFDLVCCEIDKDYFEAAVKRFENHKKQLTIF